MLRLREFMFEHVYLAPGAQQERGRIETMLAALFDHYAGEPAARADRGRRRARARGGLSGRDDRPLRRARALRPGRAPGVLSAVARYTQDSIERLRESADIVALISRKTDLRRVGSRWTGLCPFHEERTPSFSVDPERGLYHCFGCGVGGDAIRLRHGDRAAGLPGRGRAAGRGQPRGAQARARGPRGGAAPRSAASGCWAWWSGPPSFYATVLRDSAEAGRARDYLRERGLSEQVLADFRVGYAPKAWDRLLTGARRQGFTEDELLAAGLSTRGQERRRVRPLPRADHVPAGRRPRPRAGLRRPRDARRPGREVHQHRRGRALPQGPPAVRHRPRPSRRWPRPSA